ncbi:MAG: methyltransferase domain-containing protein [Planctomycetes bacterium]|nr:methyltransferase domain-containing protein [Planctomycetota bacterium]
MKILVAIANHGTKNRGYLDRLLAEYRSMPWQVHIVVLSDAPKTDLGEDVEVLVGAPLEDPWSLPFAHRTLFVERQDDFDLFIYSEDDTLLTTRNLQAWMDVQPRLADDQILGFLRFETYRDGELSYCGVHYHYHWNPESVVRVGGETLAHFTNEHSALSVLNRKQLKHCIASGSFDVPAHQGRYDMLVSAASDPYTQCGLQRLICTSRLEDFLLCHLPNVYLDRIGVRAEDFLPQLKVIEEIADGKVSGEQLFDPKVGLYVPREDWNKVYYPEVIPEYRQAMEFGARRILSIGCGAGDVEADWIAQGATVAAIPMDAIIGATAALRGVEVLKPNLDEAIEQVGDRLFDIVVFHDCLEHVGDPVEWIRKSMRVLANKGQVVVLAPNQLGRRLRHRVRKEAYPFAVRPSFGDSRYQFTTPRIVRGWMQGAGLDTRKTHFILRGKAARIAQMAKGVIDSVFANAFIQTARKR